MKTNIVNDRGIHICKSMLAWLKYGNGETPESSGKKGDHLIGDYYVAFDKHYKAECDELQKQYMAEGMAEDAAKEKAKQEAPLIKEAHDMLVKWENNDPEVRALWAKMNEWVYAGFDETYKALGVSFDKIYYESNTYLEGKEKVEEGLAKGFFYRRPDNSVWADLTKEGLDEKLLLRSDGTSVYMTQDIGTAIRRHEDWPFDSLTYVVASEQKYHFTVLFYCLGLLGYEWAKELHHLSYGMVNLPEGKMKSREGTVVDADDLLSELTTLAKEEIIAKGREGEVEDVEETGRKIALGALNYYLLQVSPTKDMVFNPKESISFNGNTGPYLQYTGARISSILRKYEGEEGDFDGSLLSLDDEKALLKLIDSFPEMVEKAADGFDPSVIAGFLYDAAKTFSHYYHDNRILNAESPELVKARVMLVKMLSVVMRNGFALIGVPFLEVM